MYIASYRPAQEFDSQEDDINKLTSTIINNHDDSVYIANLTQTFAEGSAAVKWLKNTGLQS